MAASIRSSRRHIDSAAQTVSISSASWASRGFVESFQRFNLITSQRYVWLRTLRIRQIHSSFGLSVSHPLPDEVPDDVGGANCDNRPENTEKETCCQRDTNNTNS